MFNINKTSMIIIVILLSIYSLFIFSSNAQDGTVEINVTSLIPNKVVYNQNAHVELCKLYEETKKALKSDSFNNDLYFKLNSFIKKYKDTSSCLSALIIISSMCFLDETGNIYYNSGKKILENIIEKYPDTIQGKISVISNAMLNSRLKNYNDAIQMLEKNYEVILSIETDKYLSYFLDEAPVFDSEKNVKIPAEYYFALAYSYIDLNETQKATETLKKIIKLYPNSKESDKAQLVINNMN